ncbi:MAG: phenylalanine--tRNA ligase beta subunit-related protein [Lysinibacillus sp.]
MHIQLDKQLLHKNDALKFGIIHYTKITVDESPQMIKGRTRLYQESLYFDLANKNVSDLKGIKEWRETLKTLGADPNRYRHSAESLYRQIAKENFLTPIQNAVDLNNFFSLQYEIPVGIYDVSKLTSPVTISIGNDETTYEALNGRHVTLRNMPHCQDLNGAFGSLYVDSKRSATSEQTTEALQVFYLRPSMNEDEAMKLLTAAGNMFTQVTGGDFHIAVLSNKTLQVSF